MELKDLNYKSLFQNVNPFITLDDFSVLSVFSVVGKNVHDG